MRTLLLCLLLALMAPSVYSTVYYITPAQNWQAILGSLKPGDTAKVHEGTYSYSNGWSMTLSGSAAHPITITGFSANETRPVFDQTNGDNENSLNFNANWTNLNYLEFTGGSEGIRMGAPGATITNCKLTNLIVHDTQSSAITANFGGLTAINITLQYNEVYNTGTGTGECFYLGCVPNSPCVFANGRILNNYCHDTEQAQGGSMGSGIQIKPGSHSNIVQNNVCYNTGGPCVLVYDDYNLGRNQIIGNLVINTLDNGIQATSGVTIFNNIIINPTYWGIAITDSTDLEPGHVFRNVSILHNTIVNSTAGGEYGGILLSGISSTTNWLVSNNAVFTPSGEAFTVYSYDGSPVDFTGAKLYSNVWLGGTAPAHAPAGGLIAAHSEYEDLQNPSPTVLNLYPTTSGQLPHAGNHLHSVGYDYNGTRRNATSPTIGAYEYTTPTNPDHHPLAPGFKV